jgi:hypothetical protein
MRGGVLGTEPGFNCLSSEAVQREYLVKSTAVLLTAVRLPCAAPQAIGGGVETGGSLLGGVQGSGASMVGFPQVCGLCGGVAGGWIPQHMHV